MQYVLTCASRSSRTPFWSSVQSWTRVILVWYKCHKVPTYWSLFLGILFSNPHVENIQPGIAVVAVLTAGVLYLRRWMEKRTRMTRRCCAMTTARSTSCLYVGISIDSWLCGQPFVLNLALRTWTIENLYLSTYKTRKLVTTMLKVYLDKLCEL